MTNFEKIKNMDIQEMAKLIDREELLNNRPEYLNPQMEDEIASARHQGWNDCNSYYYDLIIKQPTVNTEQYAYWEFLSPGLFEEDPTSFICSNCGMIIDIYLTYGNYTPKDMGYNYCPRCCCKMEDEE